MRSVRGVEMVSAVPANDLDMRALGLALWRRRALILLPTLAVAVLTLVLVNLVHPRYKSEAKIMVEGRENVFLRPEAEKTIDRGAADEQAIATQVQVIQSRDIARQVIRELKLAELPEFDPVRSGISPIGAFLSAIGLGRDRLKMSPEERAMEAYYERLTVSALEKSRVITIEFQSGDPDLSARIVNAIVDAYLKLQQVAKQDQSRSASTYLASEIEKLRKTVIEADSKVEEFRAKANLYVGTNDTSLANQQLSELTTQLAAARASKADLDAKSRLVRDMLKSGKPVESADITNSDLLKRLVEQRVLLRAQLAEQSSTLLPLHPRIQELNAQISSLDTQIRGELQRVVTSLENDARIASARIETTTQALDRLKKQISGTSPQDVQLRALEREAKAQRDLLESYLARYREATARENIDAAPAEARVISRAVASNVVTFPKKLPILLVATLATAFLAAAFVLSAQILGGPASAPVIARERVVRSEIDESDTPVTAAPSVVPAAAPLTVDTVRPERRTLFARLLRRPAARPADEAAQEPRFASAEPEVASGTGAPLVKQPTPIDEPADTNALAADTEPSTAHERQPWSLPDVVRTVATTNDITRRVIVTGSVHNIGTSATSLALARALAADGKRVVLVDVALHKPTLSAMSTDPEAPGLAELVRGSATFGDVITRDKFSRVHLVAAGKIEGDVQAILASPRLRITLEALTRAYDCLVVDAGAVADMIAATFARMTPRAILVASDPDLASTKVARDQLVAAGFSEVMVVIGAPSGLNTQPAAA